MKRTLALFLTLLLALSWVAAEPLTPIHLTAHDARSVAMGDSFTALASGFQSLYGNPAGFAVGRGMITLANINMWGYVKPTTENISALTGMDFTNDQAGAISTIDTIIKSNGLGAGAAFGLGFTGGGLGLGATFVSEEYARGKTLLGTQFTSATQMNAIVGLAITLGPKDFNIKLGGDLRPFIRVEGSFSAIEMITSLMGGSSSGGSNDPLTLLQSQPALYGVGLAADLGAMFTMGPLAAGLSIRDIAPAFKFYDTNFGAVMNSDSSAQVDNGLTGQFKPEVTLGASFSPRLIPFVLEPSLYVEVKDLLALSDGQSSLWSLLHAGGELKVLSFIYFRGGVSEGWLSAGGGINLLILQADVGLFTEELSAYPGTKGRSGVAVNLRLHL